MEHVARPVRFSGELTPDLRVRMFFGHYDLRVFVTDDAYVDVGRGSLGAIPQLILPPPTFRGCVASIGQFCEFATCRVLLSGEHRNDEHVNVVFHGVPMLLDGARHFGVETLSTRPPPGLTIEHGVVVSTDAVVLPAAKLATGVVVGANAVVTGETEPYGIYAGVPARLLRNRFDVSVRERLLDARWWDFTISYLMANLATIQAGALAPVAPRYRSPTPRFAFRWYEGASGGSLRILGFTEDATVQPIESAPARVQAYVAQALGDGPYSWIADVWAGGEA